MTADYSEFLKELTELSRKHRIEVCGGYDGAFLYATSEGNKTAFDKGHYHADPNNGDFTWRREPDGNG